MIEELAIIVAEVFQFAYNADGRRVARQLTLGCALVFVTLIAVCAALACFVSSGN
jgi:hypothetical protein